MTVNASSGDAASAQLCRLLGTRFALIQAPMAGVQNHALALAVSREGALGSLPAALLSPAQLEQELQALRAGLSNGLNEGLPQQAAPLPYNLNFFCHTPAQADLAAEQAWRQALAPYHTQYGIDASSIPAGAGRAPFSEALAEVIEPFRPPVLSFHFGLPAPALLRRAKSWGAVILSSATSVEEGLYLQAHGADIVIAQGLEAGGHRGHFLSDELSQQQGLFSLLPQLVQALRVPVVAAGGIASAQGVAAALALGAAGVQVGTAYLRCDEARTSAVHRQALASPDARHTALTRLFTGRPARGIVNRLMRDLGPLSPLAPAFPMATAALAPLRAAAEAQGLADFTPLWAGQNTSGCQALPAAEVTRQLLRGLLSFPASPASKATA